MCVKAYSNYYCCWCYHKLLLLMLYRSKQNTVRDNYVSTETTNIRTSTQSKNRGEGKIKHDTQLLNAQRERERETETERQRQTERIKYGKN